MLVRPLIFHTMFAYNLLWLSVAHGTLAEVGSRLCVLRQACVLCGIDDGGQVVLHTRPKATAPQSRA